MVEVTQEDREAAASIAVLVEMRELIREGRADHHAEPFARHRIAAENAKLEQAAKAVERELALTAVANTEASSEWIDGFEFAWERVKAAIRALKGPSNAD